MTSASDSSRMLHSKVAVRSTAKCRWCSPSVRLREKTRFSVEPMSSPFGTFLPMFASAIDPARHELVKTARLHAIEGEFHDGFRRVKSAFRGCRGSEVRYPIDAWGAHSGTVPTGRE